MARECYQSWKNLNDGLKDGGWLYKYPNCEGVS